MKECNSDGGMRRRGRNKSKNKDKNIDKNISINKNRFGLKVIEITITTNRNMDQNTKKKNSTDKRKADLCFIDKSKRKELT